MTVKALTPVRMMNPVEPLGSTPTDRRITETGGQQLALWSGAVSEPIGESLRPGDVDSSTSPRTPATTRSSRTSRTATATGTTRTTSGVFAPSADSSAPLAGAPFTMVELVQAWLDCRRAKRHSASAQAFEAHAEQNLCALRDELLAGSWQPGRSICFVITRPKPREVWAAQFRDRIVHHLLYNRVAPAFHAAFSSASCACIPGRGTLYAAQRVEHAVRSVSQNWSRPAWYLKCDLANFFVAIDKATVFGLLARRITDPWWLALARTVLFHDPRGDVEVRGARELLARVPPHKSLFNAPDDTGLPIGNLSSQFFANVLLDALDQHVKHGLRFRHYVRYVDDFVLLHESPQVLRAAHADIEAFLPERLHARLNPAKTVLQPVDRGVDFVGQVVRPWSRTLRRRTLRQAIARIETLPAAEVYAAGNSYLGLASQASHGHTDLARLARALLKRGHAVDGDLSRIFRRHT